MILPGRDALVRATILAWLRRVSPNPVVSGDDPLVGRLDNAIEPDVWNGGGGTTGPPGIPGGTNVPNPAPPGGELPGPPPVPPPTVPSGTGIPGQQPPTGEPPGPPSTPGAGFGTAAVIASQAFLRSQSVEPMSPEFQSVLAFGGTSDWDAVAGTSTFAPQLATAATVDAAPAALVQLWPRVIYTDVRVSAALSVGDVGIWVRASSSGPGLVSGYLAEYTTADGRLTLYEVTDNVASQMDQTTVTLAPGDRVYIQAFGEVISMWADGSSVVEVADSLHTSGMIGFGAQAQLVGDAIAGIEVTPPS